MPETTYTIQKGTGEATEQQTSLPVPGGAGAPLGANTTVYDKTCGEGAGVDERGRGSRLEIRDEGAQVLDEPYYLDFLGSMVVATSPDGLGATVTLSSPPTSTTVFIETPLIKTYALLSDAFHSWTLNSLTGRMLSGTADFGIEIDGVAVTGLSGTLTSSEGAFTATAAKDVAVGERVTLVISGTSVPVDLEFTLVATRTSA